MAGEWNRTTLGSIATTNGYGLVDGPFGSNLPASCYTDEGIPVIRGSNLALGTSRFRAHEFVFVSPDTAKRLERSLCRPFDIVFTKKGTLGQTGLVPEGGIYDLYLLSSNQMKLTVDCRVADPLFVYYFVSSPESAQKIIRDSEATGVPKTNVTYLRDFPIALPPLLEQRAIAHILGTLDDMIELNRRMNETLEAMARALFKSWFVDFDPVRSKVEGRDQHLPKPLTDLFPDSFEHSELGEIPKRWVVGVLDQLAELVLGGDWGADEQDAERSASARCIRGADIPDLQIGGTGKMPVRFLKPSSLARRRLNDGDLVVEISGGSPTQSTGRPVLVSRELLGRLPQPLVCSNFCRLVKLKSPVFSKFVYLWLRSLYANDEFLQFENGTTGIKNLAFTLFSSRFKLCVPPPDILVAFDSCVGPLFNRQQASAAESDTLVALRDTLLPKLISGELRVENAERFIAEATA